MQNASTSTGRRPPAVAGPGSAERRFDGGRSVRSPRRRWWMRVDGADRRALERRGWRTTLEFHEDHQRDRSGVLLRAVPAWTAVAEHATTGEVRTARAPTVVAAWSRLVDRVADPAA